MTKILLALLVLTMATDASAQSRTYYDSSGRALAPTTCLVLSVYLARSFAAQGGSVAVMGAVGQSPLDNRCTIDPIIAVRLTRKNDNGYKVWSGSLRN
jgi:hypothetical protein